MNDKERLERIRKYVDEMFPVVRAAILKSPEDSLVDKGWDRASLYHQLNLNELLEHP